jgi:hypothetical protein
MKKILLASLIVALAFAGVSAQGKSGPGSDPKSGTQSQAPASVTLEGKLSFVDTQPALTVNGKSYLLIAPEFFYYAYTYGLKEGQTIKVEGLEIPARAGQLRPEYARFAVTKLSFNGKDFDLGRSGMMGQGRGMMGQDWDGTPDQGRGMMGQGQRGSDR